MLTGKPEAPFGKQEMVCAGFFILRVVYFANLRIGRSILHSLKFRIKAHVQFCKVKGLEIHNKHVMHMKGRTLWKHPNRIKASKSSA